MALIRQAYMCDTVYTVALVERTVGDLCGDVNKGKAGT